MATHPFRENEERIATGGLAARLLRNADPPIDPNGCDAHCLPITAGTGEGSEEAGAWLGRWAVLVIFMLTTALAGAFLVFWIVGEPAASGPEAAERLTIAPPSPAVPHPHAPVPEPQPTTAAATPPVPASPPAPVAQPPTDSAGLRLTEEEIRALLTRGNALLAAGDLAAARPLLERAALAGDATAALRLGQSYDPGYLAGAALRERAGNLGLAIFWYRRGQELGNGTAAFLARKLETAARAGWGSVSAGPPAWRP
jgi:hypothetical protein